MTTFILRFLKPALSSGMLSLVMFTGCSSKMLAKMDAAWETLDPMGHRSEHQAHNFARGKSTGLRLPYED